jgi:hypothetical protein
MRDYPRIVGLIMIEDTEPVINFLSYLVGGGNLKSVASGPIEPVMIIEVSRDKRIFVVPKIVLDDDGDVFLVGGNSVASHDSYRFEEGNSPESFGVTVLEVMDPRELFELRAVRDGKASVPLMDGAL